MAAAVAVTAVKCAATAGLALGAVGATVPAMFSVMLFDAPGSEEDPATWSMALSMLTAPATLAASASLVWTAPVAVPPLLAGHAAWFASERTRHAPVIDRLRSVGTGRLLRRWGKSGGIAAIRAAGS